MGANLPPELWLKIFSLLSPRDLAAVACVCGYASKLLFHFLIGVPGIRECVCGYVSKIVISLFDWCSREWRGVALMPHLWSSVRVNKRRLIKDGFHQVLRHKIHL